MASSDDINNSNVGPKVFSFMRISYDVKSVGFTAQRVVLFVDRVGLDIGMVALNASTIFRFDNDLLLAYYALTNFLWSLGF
ncbi:hypothetical protein PVK06_003979 [Gossypium arboreum]|uniref:Uncharacterized protein n=1 Tax=Gossypium arboreum TaxID=29729 RepID=A0ABR0QS08_GOSAR|nr:hypothetical protein PVK06_003979 [Gossypium arboreum]